jgi:predicted transcriptional regulator
LEEEKIPADLKALILEKIDSIGQLEILILLAQTPGEKWDAIAVSKHLRGNASSVEKQLKHLHTYGLISIHTGEETRFSYPPLDEKTSQILKDLPEQYSRLRHRLISMIYNKPREHIQALVDSFKIGKGNEDG